LQDKLIFCWFFSFSFWSSKPCIQMDLTWNAVSGSYPQLCYKPAIPLSIPCSILFTEATPVELCTQSAGSPTRTSLAWREPHAARQPPQPPRWVSSCLVSRIFFTRNSTLQRNLDLCIPRKGIAWPQSQFPHSCERFIYSQDQSTYFPAAGYADRSEEYINRS
jgi:hypothetical protein